MRGTYTGVFRLNVRKGPGTRHDVVRTIAPGESVEVEAVDGGWAKVEGGWVMSDKLEFAEMVEGPDLAHMTVKELKEVAEGLGIEVKQGTKKADIVAAIENERGI